MISTSANNQLARFCIAVGLLAALFQAVPNTARGDVTSGSDTQLSTAVDVQGAFISVANKLKPSTVFITSEFIKPRPRSRIRQLLRNFPFAVPLPKGSGKTVELAAGSGVIVRPDGYILTDDHVVSGATVVTVKLSDGREFPGKVLEDTSDDLALVKIDASGLPAAEMGDSDKVEVGQWAIAIGNPFELTNTVTVGVVSALTREALVGDSDTLEGLQYYSDLIQTDASINPGNSGGPLVDILGRVIGINTIIETPSQGNVGIGFAIPSNRAKFAMDQLIAQGKVIRGYLGLAPRDISASAAGILGVSRGALVESVGKGTPADGAGIKPMDVITEIDGKVIDRALDLRRVVTRLKPGTTVPVVVVRDGKKRTVQVTVGEAPAKIAQPKGERIGAGLVVQNLTQSMAKELGASPDTKGVVVTSVTKGGAASLADPAVEVGDIILTINNKQTETVSLFDAVMAKLKPGDVALILIERKGRTLVSEMTME